MCKPGKEIKRIMELLIFSVAMLLLLVGCIGKKKSKDYLKDIKTNTMTINEDGSIDEIACEDFSTVTYDVSGLEDDIKSQVTAYSDANGADKVKFLQFENKDGLVRVALWYAGLDDYNSFNNTKCRLEAASTVPEDMELKDLSGNTVVAQDVIKDGFKAFYIDESTEVHVKGQVLYYNADVVLNSENNAATTDGQNTAVIIYQ